MIEVIRREILLTYGHESLTNGEERFWTCLCTSFFQLPCFTKSKRHIYQYKYNLCQLNYRESVDKTDLQINNSAFEIQVLSTLGIKYGGDFKIFQFA